MLEGQENSISLASFLQKSVLRYRPDPNPCVRQTNPTMAVFAGSAFRLSKVVVQPGRSSSADPGRLKFSSFGRCCFRIHRILIHRKECDISSDFTFGFKSAFEYQYTGFATDIADRKFDRA